MNYIFIFLNELFNVIKWIWISKFIFANCKLRSAHILVVRVDESYNALCVLVLFKLLRLHETINRGHIRLYEYFYLVLHVYLQGFLYL